MPKLTVRIQDPELGKGWYKVFVDMHPQTSDEDILPIVRQREPKATAAQITREYAFLDRTKGAM